MADQTPPVDPSAAPAAPAAPESTKKAKAAPVEDTTVLHFIGAPYSGTLMIGTESFEVKDGAVDVPSRLLLGAQQAGFR